MRMPEIHSALCQPEGELTQVEVWGLWRDGEGRGLGKHLTTNCGCRTDGAAIHLLKGLPVAVHVSLESRVTKRPIIVPSKEWKTYPRMFAFYLLRSPSGVHCYGVDKLRRDTADGRADRDIRGGIVICGGLALACDTAVGQSFRFVWGRHVSLHPCVNTQQVLQSNKSWSLLLCHRWAIMLSGGSWLSAAVNAVCTGHQTLQAVQEAGTLGAIEFNKHTHNVNEWKAADQPEGHKHTWAWLWSAALSSLPAAHVAVFNLWHIPQTECELKRSAGGYSEDENFETDHYNILSNHLGFLGWWGLGLGHLCSMEKLICFQLVFRFWTYFKTYACLVLLVFCKLRK